MMDFSSRPGIERIINKILSFPKAKRKLFMSSLFPERVELMKKRGKGMKRSKLIKGDNVKIYADPVTCTNLEGKTRLIKYINRNYVGSFRFERWKVRFDNSEFESTYERRVNLDNC